MTKTVLTFSLPEDMHSDRVTIWESIARDDVYQQVDSQEYRYGDIKLSTDTDPQKWYKLRFENTASGDTSQFSEAVYGGTVSHSQGFVAVSTTTDGANYATTEDVYKYSGLNPRDADEDRVSQSLRRARAVIDWRTAEMDFARLDIYESEIRRRKYNAALRILKEAEINMALGNLYQNLADDLIIESRREGQTLSGGTAIGGTSVGGDKLSERSENIQFLNAVSDRYFITAERLLSNIAATSVRLVGSDLGIRMPKFSHPFATRRGVLRLNNWW